MTNRPRVPNLLRSRRGRLGGFFALYVGEGLPQGFTATAVALEFKRMGMTGAAIGSFIATIMLPWTWKWAIAPLVDNFHLKQFGRRKQWIVLAQCGMLVSLVAALLAFPKAGTGGMAAGMALFSALLVIHNVFAASQDVAIDGLACSVLPEEERGLANGLMFAGAQVGAAIGGAGVIHLKAWVGFGTASMIVPLVLAGILLMVLLLIFEHHLGETTAETPSGALDEDDPPGSAHPHHPVHHRLQHLGRKIGAYLGVVLKHFFLTRRGLLCLLLAVVPFGGMALSLTVSTVLSPTLGMSDSEIANLGLLCSVVFVVCCMTGGFLSDRFGRRLTLGVFSAGTLLPTLWIAWRLKAEGWVMPSPTPASGQWQRHEALISAWWTASLVYSVFQGLMYGIRTAFYMDLVEPRVATTQFTICMALLNLVTIYSYAWQGQAVTPLSEGGWGFSYQQIFLFDAALGSVFLLLLPWVKPAKKPA